MKSMRQARLISFLQSELAIPEDWIALGQRQSEQNPNLLLMILWQYGLITLAQLEQVFDWWETP